MARAPSETVRLLYHSRTLVVSVVGMVVAVIGAVVASRQAATYFVPLVALTFGVLGVSAWRGWLDYSSATTLAIDARGVTFARRTIPWPGIRSVKRGAGAFRIRIGTEAGNVHFQLLVLPRPIVSLKLLVSEATKAGATIEPYLARLAEHVEEEDTSDEPDPA